MTYPVSEKVKTRRAYEKLLDTNLVWLISEINCDCLSSSVLATGSLVQGLGNVCSDVDIICISDEKKNNQHFYSNRLRRWVDVVHLSLEEANNLKSRVEINKNILPVDWSSYKSISSSAVALYYRICSSIELAKGIDTGFYHGDWIHEIFIKEYSYYNILLSRSFWSDAVGAYLSGHYAQSIDAANIAISYAVDSYTAFLGEGYPGEKWRWAKLNRLKKNPLNLSEEILKCGKKDKTDAENKLYSLNILIYQISHFAIKNCFTKDISIISKPIYRYEITAEGVKIHDAYGHRV